MESEAVDGVLVLFLFFTVGVSLVLVLFLFFAVGVSLVLVLLRFFPVVVSLVLVLLRFFPVVLWFPKDVVLGIAGKSILAGKGSSTGTRLLLVDASTGCVFFFLCFGGPLHP